MSELDRCPICGLPKELCVCGEISKEHQIVKIKLEKRKWRKEVTLIEGLVMDEKELEELVSELKTRCACGGTAKNGVILLQGNHVEKVKKVLIEKGLPEEQIELIIAT